MPGPKAGEGRTDDFERELARPHRMAQPSLTADLPAVDPAQFEIVRIRALRGPNYWRLAPVVACDLRLGPLESFTTADMPGFTARLIAAVPTLQEHPCSR